MLIYNNHQWSSLTTSLAWSSHIEIMDSEFYSLQLWYSEWYFGFFSPLLLCIYIYYIHTKGALSLYTPYKIIPDVIDTSLFCVYVPTNTFLLVQLDNNNNIYLYNGHNNYARSIHHVRQFIYVIILFSSR